MATTCHSLSVLCGLVLNRLADNLEEMADMAVDGLAGAEEENILGQWRLDCENVKVKIYFSKFHIFAPPG